MMAIKYANQIDMQVPPTEPSHVARRQDLLDEAVNREQQINDAIGQEATAREKQVGTLNTQIITTNAVLAGVHAATLVGEYLTRVINGVTEVARNLFSPSEVFVQGKTLINDVNGTVGVYIGDADAATIIIRTKTTSHIGVNEPTLLGNVAANADLPLTVTDAESVFGRTPNLDDYANVLSDETMNGWRVEWYITAIDGGGNISWGNPVAINTGDSQAQTGAQDAGKVLTGGAIPGTFGTSLEVDAVPTQGSNNLVRSGGVFSWFGAAVSTLSTTAKTVVAAVNELFANKANLASPALTGNPTATTQAVGNNSTRLATTEFVKLQFTSTGPCPVEQGSWTPVLRGATTAGTFTYTVQSGSYRRVGKKVTVWGRMQISGRTGSPSGMIQIGGLPFSGLGNQGLAMLGAWEGYTVPATVKSIIFYMTGGTSYNIYYSSHTGVSWTNSNIATDVLNNFYIDFSAEYMIS